MLSRRQLASSKSDPHVHCRENKRTVYRGKSQKRNKKEFVGREVAGQWRRAGGYSHRRMRRVGGGGGGGREGSCPPKFGQNSGENSGKARNKLTMMANRSPPPWNVDDVTQVMSKGGGVLVECLHPPPSGNPVSAPVICVKFRAKPPLTKAFPYAFGYSAPGPGPGPGPSCRFSSFS